MRQSAMHGSTSDKQKRHHVRAIPCTKSEWNESDAIESIRQGLLEAKQGLGRDADEFFDELEREDSKP